MILSNLKLFILNVVNFTISPTARMSFPIVGTSWKTAFPADCFDRNQKDFNPNQQKPSSWGPQLGTAKNWARKK